MMTMHVWRILTAAAACLLGTGAWAQDGTIPSGGEPLLAGDPLASADFWSGDVEGQPVAHWQRVAVDGPGFSEAAEIRVETIADELWNGQLSFPFQHAVAEGDVALMHFWMRVTASVDETGTGTVGALVERNAEPHTKSVLVPLTAAGEWVPVYLPFTFAESYTQDEVIARLTFGQGVRRTVQVGGLQLLNFKDSLAVEDLPRMAFSYGGRDADASWRAAAEERIEAHRKGDFSLTLRSETGLPLSDAEVFLELERHAFQFGTAIVSARIMDQSADGILYREKLLRHFNAAGPENDLKWPALEGDWGDGFNRAQTKQALEWLRLRDFHLRGHVLVWPSVRNLPNHIAAMWEAEDPAIPDEVLAHIERDVAEFNPWLTEWDVLNEPYDNHQLMDRFGESIMADWFRAAREAARPGTGLYLNDYGILSSLGMDTAHQEHFLATARSLREESAPLTGLGFQGHFHESGLTAITRIYEILETYAEAFPGLDFRVTEFDVETPDEDLQADYFRDFLTIIFSHPQVVGLQTWGFWAGQHWRPSAALYDEDWREKPAATVFHQLVHETWTTRLSDRTNENGTVTGRGFKGQYAANLTTDDGHYALTMPIDAADVAFVLYLPSAATLDQPRFLPPPARGYLALALPAHASESAWLESSRGDLSSWRPQSVAVSGPEPVRIHIWPAPEETTFWRWQRSE